MDIAAKIDHTILKPDTLPEEVERVCREAEEYGFAAVCIPPCFVQQAANHLESTEVKIATVVGFPMGYSDTESKVIETSIAIEHGANEIDMVCRIGSLKSGDMNEFSRDIEEVYQECNKGEAVLKVILETALLSEEQIIKACEKLNDIGVDFAKTSTGFNGGGATVEAISLMRKHLNPEISIKASGGIRTKEEAEKMITYGADRIGASKSINLL